MTPPAERGPGQTNSGGFSSHMGACTTYACSPVGNEPMGTKEWVILGAAAAGPLVLYAGWEATLWALTHPVAALGITEGLVMGDAAGGGTVLAAGAAAGLAAKGGAQVLRSAGAAVNRTVNFGSKQLQAKFGHAADFGVTGPWNKNSGAEFQNALQGHLDDPGTMAIMGTYRGDEVTHFVNPTTGLNVMRGMDDAFVSGWRLNAAQLENVLTRGSL